MSKINSPHKKETSMGCVKELPMEKNVKRLIFEEMCQFWFSCDLFVFVLFCGAFCKAVFDSNFGFSGFAFLSL